LLTVDDPESVKIPGPVFTIAPLVNDAPKAQFLFAVTDMLRTPPPKSTGPFMVKFALLLMAKSPFTRMAFKRFRFAAFTSTVPPLIVKGPVPIAPFRTVAPTVVGLESLLICKVELGIDRHAAGEGVGDVAETQRTDGRDG